MHTRLALWMTAGVVGIACNAVLGLEELDKKPSGGSGADGGGDAGGTSGTGAGKGGSAGSSAGKGGTSGEGGGGDGSCEPDHETTCSTAFPTLLGNCRDGQVVCQANGTWGDCSVTPQSADSCDEVGDDADCDGTENGGCPCIDGATRDCGPDTEDGICQLGTQTCENEVWGDCEGAVFPGERDCLSTADNDCDGAADNVRDDVCPCAVEGTHTCVEDAPTDWSGPMALATGPGGSASPSCSGTGYERQVLALFGAIDEGDTTCNCACSTPTGTCGSSICVHRTTTSQSCSLAGINIGDTCEHTVSVNSCFNATVSAYYKPMQPTFTATSTCNVQRTADIETPVWTRRMVGCETNDASAPGCAAQAQCMPDLVNPLEAFCIYQNGEHACPSGPFSEQTIYYESFADGRSCTNCSCGAATGNCPGSLHFSYQNISNCSGQLLLDAVDFGSCANIDASFAPVANPTTPTPMGSCPPSGGALQGSVTRNGAVTVCCMP